MAPSIDRPSASGVCHHQASPAACMGIGFSIDSTVWCRYESRQMASKLCDGCPLAWLPLSLPCIGTKAPAWSIYHPVLSAWGGDFQSLRCGCSFCLVLACLQFTRSDPLEPVHSRTFRLRFLCENRGQRVFDAILAISRVVIFTSCADHLHFGRDSPDAAVECGSIDSLKDRRPAYSSA